MPGGSLLFGFLGIAAVISLSSLLSPIKALGWLRYAGSNSIVVYRGYFIPLTMFLHVVATQKLQIDFYVLATLAVVLGAGTPLLLLSFVKKSALRFLFVRPAWAHLVSPRVKPLWAGIAEEPKP